MAKSNNVDSLPVQKGSIINVGFVQIVVVDIPSRSKRRGKNAVEVLFVYPAAHEQEKRKLKQNHPDGNIRIRRRLHEGKPLVLGCGLRAVFSEISNRRALFSATLSD